MRNTYITAQIKNMLSVTTVFQQSCRMAALEDDNSVDKQEEKILKAIEGATEKYRKQLEKILEKY